MVARSLVKITVPVAFEIPLGTSTMLNAAFSNFMRPLICGSLKEPRTVASVIDAAGGDEVLAEILQQAEIHPPIHAQVERVLLFRQHAPRDAEIGVAPHQVRALHGDHGVGEAHHDRSGILQRERLRRDIHLRARDRFGTAECAVRPSSPASSAPVPRCAARLPWSPRIAPPPRPAPCSARASSAPDPPSKNSAWPSRDNRHPGATRHRPSPPCRPPWNPDARAAPAPANWR